MGLLADTGSEIYQIKQMNANFVQSLKGYVKASFIKTWKKIQDGQLVDKSPSEVQAIMDSFGTDASKAFDAHEKLQMVIMIADPAWVPLVPPLAYVINEDGSVVISQ
jgi:hypothetical protein